MRKGTPITGLVPQPGAASFLRIDSAGGIIVAIGLTDPDQRFALPYNIRALMCPAPRLLRLPMIARSKGAIKIALNIYIRLHS